MAPATLLVSPAGIRTSAAMTGSLALTVPGATLESGTFTLSFDTTLAVPTFGFSSTNAAIKVGGVSVSGGLAFNRTVAVDGAVRSTLTLTSVGASLGLLSVSNGNGTVTFGAGGLAGSFSATLATNSSALGLTGVTTVGVDIDTATGRLAVTITGLDVSVAGLTVHGDLALTRTLNATGGVQLTVGLNNASLTVPGVALTNGSGSFTASGTAYAGSFTGHVALTVPEHLDERHPGGRLRHRRQRRAPGR